MDVLKIGNKSVKLYADIDETPSNVYQKFNKYMLIDSQIGSDFADIYNTHIKNMGIVLADPDKLKIQLQNMTQLISFILDETNVEVLAFTSLIYSINREVITDRSEPALRRIIECFGDDLTIGMVKKKLTKYIPELIMI